MYAKDLQSGTLTMVSSLVGYDPALSADGNYIAFTSPDPLSATDAIGPDRVYAATINATGIGDLWSPTTTASDEETVGATMSGDGSLIAFESYSNDSAAKPSGYLDAQLTRVRVERTGRLGIGTVTGGSTPLSGTGPAYVTLDFGRTNWVRKAVSSCTPGTYSETLLDVATWLHSRMPPISGVGNLIPDWTNPPGSRKCNGGVLYPSSDDISNLHTNYGWQFVSAGQNYTPQRSSTARTRCRTTSKASSTNLADRLLRLTGSTTSVLAIVIGGCMPTPTTHGRGRSAMATHRRAS